MIGPTTQCDNDPYGSTATTADRNAMVTDAMNRATAGSAANYGPCTHDWTQPTPPHRTNNG